MPLSVERLVNIGSPYRGPWVPVPEPVKTPSLFRRVCCWLGLHAFKKLYIDDDKRIAALKDYFWLDHLLVPHSWWTSGGYEVECLHCRDRIAFDFFTLSRGYVSMLDEMIEHDRDLIQHNSELGAFLDERRKEREDLA